MNYDKGKRVLRRIVRGPRLWSFLRRGLVTYQYLTRQPDEPEIRVFGALNRLGIADLTFVDIGANGGQTAVGIARVLPAANIESFEPNPTLWKELDWVGRLVGDRHRRHHFGLGSESGEMTLFVPYVDRLPVTTRGSLSTSVASQRADELVEETGRQAVVMPLQVAIRRFDDLDLNPHGVKIDVEGVELEVLRGMTATIGKCRPLLMLEYNDETSECRSLLAEFGYDFWDFDPLTESLRQVGKPAIRNWFAVPCDTRLRSVLGLT